MTLHDPEFSFASVPQLCLFLQLQFSCTVTPEKGEADAIQKPGHLSVLHVTLLGKTESFFLVL